ncbi:single-stranded DNA-binding protein, mitochondrial [Euphorbia lathyris]|uniref:single-stranded DNA-binding protein, mitochondrial n=1 Tax=Euphorbia lathyris TaxID=212925 RepID=UPI0033144D0A
MGSVALKFANLLRSSSSTTPVVGLQRSLRSWYSTGSSTGGNINELDEQYDDFLGEKPELQLQGVDPRKGWGSRGVHKAIICGKVGKAPEQKILRNGRTVTIFTVGTGGMFDQRLVGSKDLPKPAQWHRIAVHNEHLGTYAVQQLAKDTPVYVEGDIEIRVYNDSISGEVKNIPEICVRRDGRIRHITSANRMNDISFDDLKEGLFS